MSMKIRPVTTGSSLLLSAVCVAVLSGCSSNGSDSPLVTPSSEATAGTSAEPSRAAQWCSAALGADKVLSSGPVTTVGELRRLTQGPGFRPAKDAFPGLPGTAPAAYCWTRGAGDVYDSFGVTDGGLNVKLVSVAGLTAVPSGPPVVP
jgi:hypothetical protein